MRIMQTPVVRSSLMQQQPPSLRLRELIVRWSSGFSLSDAFQEDSLKAELQRGRY
jgi:hypothetical protein